MDGALAGPLIRVRRLCVKRDIPRTMDWKDWRWPAPSPDLTRLYFYLLGAVKNEVYSKRRTTVQQVQGKIAEVIENLQRVDMEKARQSLIRRCVACREIQA